VFYLHSIPIFVKDNSYPQKSRKGEKAGMMHAKSDMRELFGVK
jgi:hypothetical protein